MREKKGRKEKENIEGRQLWCSPGSRPLSSFTSHPSHGTSRSPHTLLATTLTSHTSGASGLPSASCAAPGGRESSGGGHGSTSGR
jgi:hypothetical protein